MFRQQEGPIFVEATSRSNNYSTNGCSSRIHMSIFPGVFRDESSNEHDRKMGCGEREGERRGRGGGWIYVSNGDSNDSGSSNDELQRRHFK